MDTNEAIKLHSREKLAVYREYLLGYLSVLVHVKFVSSILVVDLFAGVGINKHGEEGSAVIAAKIISGFPTKNIVFWANEKDRNRCARLSSSLSAYKFATVFNESADSFVSQFSNGFNSENMRNLRALFFIDPFGYTQLSQPNLNELMRNDSVEILIFMPVSQIYRFITKSAPESTVKPVLNFLNDCGINIKTLNITNQNDFIKTLEDNYKKRANTSFVYHYELTNKEAKNSQFCLFFITHNAKGADKFIEAMYGVKKTVTQQQTLFAFMENNLCENMQKYLSDYRNNSDINDWRRENAYHTTEVRQYLTELEKQGKLELEILDNSTRRKGSFYLDKKPKIRVRIKP